MIRYRLICCNGNPLRLWIKTRGCESSVHLAYPSKQGNDQQRINDETDSAQGVVNTMFPFHFRPPFAHRLKLQGLHSPCYTGAGRHFRTPV